jgi:hypothetical protein
MAANPSGVVPRSVGVTCPGPIDRLTGAMKPIGMPTWHDFPIRRELADVTGLPVGIDTPGRGLALAELWCGESPTSIRRPAVRDAGARRRRRRWARGRWAARERAHRQPRPVRAPHRRARGLVCACGAVGCLTIYAGAAGITKEHQPGPAADAGGDRRADRDHGRPGVCLDGGDARRRRDRDRRRRPVGVRRTRSSMRSRKSSTSARGSPTSSASGARCRRRSTRAPGRRGGGRPHAAAEHSLEDPTPDPPMPNPVSGEGPAVTIIPIDPTRFAESVGRTGVGRVGRCSGSTGR